MKATHNNSVSRILVVLFVSAMIFSSSEIFAKKFEFQLSALDPAAQGYVNVKTDNNKNYLIEVYVSNLAQVERLQPAKRAYVIWMITNNEQTKNLGQLKSSTTFLSTKLKAHFETTTPLRPVKIFITAEDDPTTQSPGDRITLTTDKIKVK
jgi:hypothetical protein